MRTPATLRMAWLRAIVPLLLVAVYPGVLDTFFSAVGLEERACAAPCVGALGSDSCPSTCIAGSCGQYRITEPRVAESTEPVATVAPTSSRVVATPLPAPPAERLFHPPRA